MAAPTASIIQFDDGLFVDSQAGFIDIPFAAHPNRSPEVAEGRAWVAAFGLLLDACTVVSLTKEEILHVVPLSALPAAMVADATAAREAGIAHGILLTGRAGTRRAARLEAAEVAQWLLRESRPARWAFTDGKDEAELWRLEELAANDAPGARASGAESLVGGQPVDWLRYGARRMGMSALWVVELREDDWGEPRIVLVTEHGLLARDVSAGLNLAIGDTVRAARSGWSVSDRTEAQVVDDILGGWVERARQQAGLPEPLLLWRDPEAYRRSIDGFVAPDDGPSARGAGDARSVLIARRQSFGADSGHGDDRRSGTPARRRA